MEAVGVFAAATVEGTTPNAAVDAAEPPKPVKAAKAAPEGAELALPKAAKGVADAEGAAVLKAKPPAETAVVGAPKPPKAELEAAGAPNPPPKAPPKPPPPKAPKPAPAVAAGAPPQPPDC